MSKSSETKAPVAVLNAPRTSLPLIMFAQKVHDSVLNNPNFPNPVPALSVFAGHIDELEDAVSKAASRTKGAVALRNATMRSVQEDLSLLCAYVQSVVAEAMTPAEATEAIESAYMSVKKVTPRSNPEVSAKSADVSGKVVLAAKSVSPRAVYAWEYSVDQSKWTPVPEVMKSRTEVSGLTPACIYFFRFRALTRAGWQDYSHVVSLVVR